MTVVLSAFVFIRRSGVQFRSLFVLFSLITGCLYWVLYAFYAFDLHLFFSALAICSLHAVLGCGGTGCVLLSFFDLLSL